MNVAMLKKKINENGFNVESIADKIGIDRSTLYRKLNGEVRMTICEANKMKQLLNMTSEEARSIFFD